MNVMHRYLFAKAHLCKLGAARGERWGGGGEEVSPFLALWRLRRQNFPRTSTSEPARRVTRRVTRRATYLLVKSVTGVSKQDELQLTELKRRVDLQTLGWYTEHAAHEDTASQSSPV